jgi:DNA-directed RNA polymerase specialized sigma24 family protein
MDEVLELCRRVLGAGQLADEAAMQAWVQDDDERIARLTAAARACRQLADEQLEPAELRSAPEAAVSGPGTRGRPLGEAVARELAAASARLPERQREALALRELLRLSYTEISRVMELDHAAVGPLLARARLRLRSERRGSDAESHGTCSERERSLRILAYRQDAEPISHEDEDWLLKHLGECGDCQMSHSAMLEASVTYRAWA